MPSIHSLYPINKNSSHDFYSSFATIGTIDSISKFEYKLFHPFNGYRIYVDIISGENCHHFRLLTLTSFIGQFVNPVGGEGMG